MSIHDDHKRWIAPLRAALYHGVDTTLKDAIQKFFAPDAKKRMGFPFQEMSGAKSLWEEVYAPLRAASPHIERRDFIVMSGPRWNSVNWVMVDMLDLYHQLSVDVFAWMHALSGNMRPGDTSASDMKVVDVRPAEMRPAEMRPAR